MTRLQKTYTEIVVPELAGRLGCSNVHQIPKVVKIVINMGVSDAKENPKAIDSAASELASITGQKPQVRFAKKSISAFKLRQGMPIGLKVTLRGQRMYEFLDRLVNIAIPRIKDFKGVNQFGFDGRGNYNLGLNEQYIFPEISATKSEKARGMNITIVTTATTDEAARQLLESMGMPFKRKEETKGKKEN